LNFRVSLQEGAARHETQMAKYQIEPAGERPERRGGWTMEGQDLNGFCRFFSILLLLSPLKL